MSKVYHYDFKEINVTSKIKHYMRSLVLSNLESINIMRLGEDIVLSDGRVPSHTDGTVKGKDTIMLVLTADNGFTFTHESCDISIKTGDIVRFNGNQMHSIYCNKQTGRFSAIIWDVKLDVGIDDLLFDFQNRLKELNKQIKKGGPVS